MNIHQKMLAWSDYHIRLGDLSGFAHETTVYKMMESGTITDSPTGGLYPRGIEMTDPGTLKVIRSINAAIDALKVFNPVLHDVVMLYYFSGIRNHRLRGKAMNYSGIWYRKKYKIAHDWLDYFLNIKRN